MNALKDVASKYATVPYKVAETLASVAQSYIRFGGNFGWPNPPYLTGNLFRKFGSYNTPSNTIREMGSAYKIVLNYAPDGATYGYFAETGTGTHSAKGPRPFAKNASGAAETQTAIADYQRSQFIAFSEEVNNQIGIIFGKSFTKK
jgi:hypothetical protein